MYRLVISDDAGKTTVVMLVRDEITIGRADDNHICLTERNVSRHHAKVVRRDDAYAIVDLESYNGVKVNGRRIERDLALSPGDRVVLGDYQLRFESEATGSMAGEEDVEVEAPLPARLVMLTAPAPGAEFALARLPTRLGRSEDIDVTVNHRSISREHAEFFSIDGALAIKDLDSANGVRVNGEDVGEATLEDGDVLEFGQVRFRYVGEGIEYAFDPEAPDAALGEAEDEPAQRMPIVAAVLILVVAVAAAAAIAVKGARDRRDREVPEASAQAVDRSAELASSIRACEEAVNGGRFDDALRSAERAVAIDANASAAHDCRSRANAGANAASIAESAVAGFRAGDVVRAYRDLERIPTGSEVLRRPDVLEVAKAYVVLKSNEAEAAIGRADGAAAAMAATEAVAAVDAFSLDDRREAVQALMERARTGATAPTPGQPAPATNVTPGDLVAAQACLTAGDVECVVAATQGLYTLPALDLRFKALSRARGRRADALRTARELVNRFPASGAGQRAQRYLEPPAAPAPTP